MPIDFVHYEIYYEKYYSHFNKPCDRLVLFIHWLMIQNRFKCSVKQQENGSTVLTELLPDKWNKCEAYYDLRYQRNGFEYQLEIFIFEQNKHNDVIHILLTKLSDSTNSSQEIKTAEYMNLNYDSNNYKLAYKDLDTFYKRVQWTISHFRKDMVAESNKISQTGQQKTDFKFANFLKYIKAEKEDFDTQMEIIRRNSNCTVSISISKGNFSSQRLCEKKALNQLDSAAVSIIEANKTNQFKVIKNVDGELVQITNAPSSATPSNEISKPSTHAKGRANIYDYNPITNYFYYNKTTAQRRLDQKLIEENDLIKDLFKKYNLKYVDVNIHDCLNYNSLRDQNKLTNLNLTEQVKQDLNYKPCSFFVSSSSLLQASSVKIGRKKKTMGKRAQSYSNLKRKSSILSNKIDLNDADASQININPNYNNLKRKREDSVENFDLNNSTSLKLADMSANSNHSPSNTPKKMSFGKNGTLLNFYNKVKLERSFESGQTCKSANNSSSNKENDLDQSNNNGMITLKKFYNSKKGEPAKKKVKTQKASNPRLISSLLVSSSSPPDAKIIKTHPSNGETSAKASCINTGINSFNNMFKSNSFAQDLLNEFNQTKLKFGLFGSSNQSSSEQPTSPNKTKISIKSKSPFQSPAILKFFSSPTPRKLDDSN